MTKKIYFVILVSTILVSNMANARYAYKSADTISFKAGAIIANNTTIENTGDTNLNYDVESNGGSFQAEYDFNYETFLIGVGLEYSYLRSKLVPASSQESEYFRNHFLSPSFNIKFATPSGIYFGAGGAAKYMLKTQTLHGLNFEKKIDLWVQTMLGYYIPINDEVFADFGVKLGYNITNQQYKIVKGRTNNSDYEGKTAYDLTIYAGIGYKINSY